jgi:segregation and condensation protein B
MPDDAPNPDDLGRTYAALLERGPWESDPHDEGAAAAGPPPAEPAAPPPLARIVEAMLFIGGAPLTAERACEAVRKLTPPQFLEVIDALNRDYRRQGRPYWVQSRAEGYVLALRSRYRAVTERLYGGGRQARLSPAAIDVLSVIAYRQPVTKQEVDTLRGGESGSLLRQLVRRGLVAVYQRAGGEGGEVTYGTTRRFLDLFNLRSLDDLPQTQDLQKI